MQFIFPISEAEAGKNATGCRTSSARCVAARRQRGVAGLGAVVRGGVAGHLAGGRAAGNRDDARGGRLFRPSPARRKKDCAYAPTGRRPRVSRSGVALAARGRPSPSALLLSRVVRWSDAAWRGVARDELVIYELHVGTFTPEGTLDAIVAAPAAIALAGRDGDRADARGPVPRRAQLGLRRRLSLRRAEQLRRAAGAAAARRRRPPASGWP